MGAWPPGSGPCTDGAVLTCDTRVDAASRLDMRRWSAYFLGRETYMSVLLATCYPTRVLYYDNYSTRQTVIYVHKDIGAV